MLRFGETKIAREKFYAAKKPIKIQNVDHIQMGPFAAHGWGSLFRIVD